MRTDHNVLNFKCKMF